MHNTNTQKNFTAKKRRTHRVNMRVTVAQKTHLQERAMVAGMSTSEYLRRRMFPKTPILSHSDLCTIRELRRLGSLLKASCNDMCRAMESGSTLHVNVHQKKLMGVFALIYSTIDGIGKT